jgi:hypothetical protein
MSKLFSASVFLLLLFVISSCQTLSEDECIAADWRVIGERDGAEGYDPQQRFGKHVKACERAGIVPDQRQWNQGYQDGLFNFCTPQRGLIHGQAGKPYNNVCPADLERNFLDGYRLGTEEFQIKTNIRNLENRIATSERAIDDLDATLAAGAGDELDLQAEIRRHLQDIRGWNRELGLLDSDLVIVQRDIERFNRNPRPMQ